MTLTAPLARRRRADGRRGRRRRRRGVGESDAAAGSSASRSSSSSLLWLIPTVGVLVTSFRPEALAEHAPAGGRRSATRSRRGEWTLENYRQALDAGGFQNAFLNSLAVTIPSTIIPITIAAFAAYAFSWMQFRGRYVLFVLVVGPHGRAAADGAHPDPAPLHAAAPSSAACRCFPDLDLNGTFLGHLAGPHRLRPARSPPTCCATTSARCRRRSSSRPRSTAPTTSRSSGGWSCRCRCRRSPPSPSSSSSGCGTTCWSPTCSSAARRDNRVVTIALANLVGSRGENWHLLTVGRVHLDGAARCSCSSRCSATSCAASPPAR